jgi:hypothetical protein
VVEERYNSGSPATRVARAAGLGLLAGVLGAVLYYAISAMTGYEFGLIAIVVGFMVGWAVHYGSSGRGGWGYQTLAVALTYLAIVSTYIPPVLAALGEDDTDAVVVLAATDPAEEPGAADDVVRPDAGAADTLDETVSTADVIVAVLLLLAFVSAAPFLAGMENIIGLIIIAVGLYQAWSMNRTAGLTISGPHTTSAAG